MKKFFRRHQGRGSYDLFSSYSHYLPDYKGIFKLLLLFLAGALIGELILMGLKKFMGESFAITYGMIISYPVMFIPPMLYSSVQSRINEYNTPEVKLDSNNPGNWGWARLIFVCIFSTIAMAYVTEPITSLLPPMSEWVEDALKAMLEDCPMRVTLLSVSVFAPLFEEWLCRGIVLRGLLNRNVSPAKAIVVSSVFFAILHMNPWQAIPAFLLGLLFGYVYYKTGSLKLTMLMHCVNNTMAATLSKVPAFKDAETFMDILSPWAYWCIYAACLVVVFCTIMVFRTKEEAKS
jgi:membrane protease YdiL (CAAX protease family)